MVCAIKRSRSLVQLIAHLGPCPVQQKPGDRSSRVVAGYTCYPVTWLSGLSGFPVFSATAPARRYPHAGAAAGPGDPSRVCGWNECDAAGFLGSFAAPSVE